MVRIFHVILANLGIMHGRFDVLMSQNTLYLFDRHPLVNRSCGKSPSEFMRMHPINVQSYPQFTQTDLYTANLEPVVWF